MYARKVDVYLINGNVIDGVVDYMRSMTDVLNDNKAISVIDRLSKTKLSIPTTSILYIREGQRTYKIGF